MVLEKCHCVTRQLEHYGACSIKALVLLKACTQRKTIKDFEGWRNGDQRWLQLARVGISCQVLLPAQELEMHEVSLLVASLSVGGGLAPPMRLVDADRDQGPEMRRRQLAEMERQGSNATDMPPPRGLTLG